MSQNPYRPGVGKAPPYLADRQGQLQRFAGYVAGFPSNQRNVRITGLRGVGKTVLLKEFHKYLRNKGWVVISRDCAKRFQNENEFAVAIADDLQKALEGLSNGAKLARLLGDARKAIGQITVGLGGGAVSVEVGAEGVQRPHILEDRIRDALHKVGEVAAKRTGLGVAFLFDEAHVLFDQDGEAGRPGNFPLSALLAAFSDAQSFEETSLPVMLVVCGLPSLIANLRAARSHSERLFKVEIIENLSLKEVNGQPSEAVAALVQPTVGTHIGFDFGTAREVAADVAGYPYFIQWYGEALWDAADEAGLPIIDDSLYARKRGEIQLGLDEEFFDGRFEETRRAEQAVLRVAGSLNGETFSTSELLGQYPTKSQKAAVRTKLNRLIGDNLIYSIRYGEYGYTAPLFGDYLRRRQMRQPSDTQPS
jgi:hypothetical protein